MDKVSIIIPIYNSEKYIKKCLESIINQTYNELEIILINDGSSDDSINIIKKYQQKDNRIIIIDRENKGTIYSRLEGINISTGKYIMFVDSDDWIDKETVEKTLQISKKYNADIVRFYMIREQVLENIRKPIHGVYEKEKYVTKAEFEKYLYPVILNTYGCNYLCGQLIKKEVTKNITIKNDYIKLGDDLITNLEIYNNINNIVFTDNYFYHYRKTENSITNTNNIDKIKNNIRDAYEVYSKFYEMIKIWNIDTEENRRLIGNRIINEITLILKKDLLTSKYSKIEKINIIKNARKLVPENIKIDRKKLDRISQMFWDKKFNYLILYANITIVIPYKIKENIKKVLRSINKRILNRKEEKDLL